MTDYVKKSVYLSFLLRHKPEVANIELDLHGWADVKEVLRALEISMGELEKHIVQEDSKQRYSFNEDKTKIRANQGHSIPVDLDLAERNPPEFLYHGTSDKYIEDIRKYGIKKKSRNHVHLSYDKETAEVVGKRHGNPVILRILSRKMFSDGYKFYLSENNVWLTEIIPVEYIVEV